MSRRDAHGFLHNAKTDLCHTGRFYLYKAMIFAASGG